ncbi:hypothetical protein OEZ86_004574 [Tetradesmus obliquus]|nr:hypothetical protein OEZ86_004574 [Tetradesmus obliquus]
MQAATITEPAKNKPRCRVSVSPAFVAQCFPDLQQHVQRQQVQLHFTVDGVDSTPADGAEAHAGIGRYDSSGSSSTPRYTMSGADAVLRSYHNHTITGMSCAKGSTQLTLHLQSPAAAAAAQQVAEAAAAAAEADPARWQEHEGSTAHFDMAGSRLRFGVPPTLLASAFGRTWQHLGFKRAWQQPGFKVQLSVHKDGACIAGGPGDREQRSLCSSGGGSDNRCLIIPTAATPQLSGCRLTKIRAAPPNFMQAHFTSQPCSNTAAVQPPAAAHSGSQPTAAAKPAAASGGSVPAVLEQLVQLLDVTAAPDELVERLQAAAEPLLLGDKQLTSDQLAAFGIHYRLLQSWVMRQRGDKARRLIDRRLEELLIHWACISTAMFNREVTLTVMAAAC